jgi:lysyl-tRNA synthetase class 1
MYGKDLIESADLSARLCQVISDGKVPGPVRQFYEMFLDEDGRKISKSVGRGLTVDSWLSYAPHESLLLFIFKDPRKAKKLTWDVVAKTADEYLQMLQRHYQPPPAGEGEETRLTEELAFIQPGLPATSPYEYPVSYSMLLGLASAGGAPGAEVLVDYVHQYKGVIHGSDRLLQKLAEYATAYVREQLLPRRRKRALTPDEARLIGDLADYLAHPHEAEEIQNRAFEIARGAGMQPGEFFKLVYNILTGQDHGPRLGSFAKLLGQDRMAAILRGAA